MFPEKTGHSPSFHSGLRVLFRKGFVSLFLEKKMHEFVFGDMQVLNFIKRNCPPVGLKYSFPLP